MFIRSFLILSVLFLSSCGIEIVDSGQDALNDLRLSADGSYYNSGARQWHVCNGIPESTVDRANTAIFLSLCTVIPKFSLQNPDGRQCLRVDRIRKLMKSEPGRYKPCDS